MADTHAAYNNSFDNPELTKKSLLETKTEAITVMQVQHSKLLCSQSINLGSSNLTENLIRRSNEGSHFYNIFPKNTSHCFDLKYDFVLLFDDELFVQVCYITTDIFIPVAVSPGLYCGLMDEKKSKSK